MGNIFWYTFCMYLGKIHTMREYKIYCLKDPISLEIRYVGVTVNSLNARLSQHLWESKNRKGTHKINWITNLKKDNKIPIIELIEICNESNWEEKEKYWISYFLNLTNTREGGTGLIIDRKYSSIERSSRAKFKPVIQLSFSGEFIRRFESINEAVESFGLKSKSSITNALRNSNRTKGCKGFLWVYEKDYLDNNYELKIPIKRKKPVIYIDSNNVEKIFNSITELANYLKIDKSFLAKICNKKQKCNKYNIKYLNNEDIV